MAASKGRKVDMRGLILQVAGIEVSPSVGINNHLAAGSTKTLTAADGGRVLLLDTLAGSVVTLPTPTGSGLEFEFVTSVVPTSNSHIVKVVGATDYMTGSLAVVNNSSGAVTVFGTTGSTTTRSDTITLNRGTSGAVNIGERFWVKDTAAGYWSVRGTVSGSGTIITPFSASVS